MAHTVPARSSRISWYQHITLGCTRQCCAASSRSAAVSQFPLAVRLINSAGTHSALLRNQAGTCSPHSDQTETLRPSQAQFN